MLIFGGIILDKMGVRFTGMGACLLMECSSIGRIYYAMRLFPHRRNVSSKTHA